jgi:hypothetical protein
MDSDEAPVLAAGWAGTALRFDGIDDYALVREFQVRVVLDTTILMR